MSFCPGYTLRVAKKPLYNFHTLGEGFWTRTDEPNEPIDPWDEEQVPWWALYCVAPGGEAERRVRSWMAHGLDPLSVRSREYAKAWESFIARVQEEVRPLDPRFWVSRERDVMSRIALRDPRSFCQLAEITTDRGQPLVLADFQVRGILAMRQQKQWLGLWPFEHGKSYLASVMVSLMDWAEERESTQIRIYYADAYKLKFSRRLMWLVNGGAPQLTRLFPWIRKPMSANEKANERPECDPAPGKDDPCLGYWSTDAFSIGGKAQPDASFRGLTANSGQTGWRGWRVIADDLVNAKNAPSEKVQDYLEDFVHTGAQTMPISDPPPPSTYMTRFGTFGMIGTLFHPRDVNSRIYDQWRVDPDARVTRLDIFPRGPEENDEGEVRVLWPRGRPLEKVYELQKRLGNDAFNMRCRNIPNTGHGVRMFKRGDIEMAKVHLPYGQAPPGTRCLIGFDPAKGKRTKYAKNPALFLIGVHQANGNHHWIRWQRLRGLNQLRQTEVLVAWAREYRCPVAIEDNYDMDVYRDHLKTVDPSGTVRIISHTTSVNKRDPIDGVARLINLLERQGVRIHGDGCDTQNWADLLGELTDWPDGIFSDLLMALWVAEYQLALHTEPAKPAPRVEMPGYVTARGLGGLIDMRPYQNRRG